MNSPGKFLREADLHNDDKGLGMTSAPPPESANGERARACSELAISRFSTMGGMYSRLKDARNAVLVRVT